MITFNQRTKIFVYKEPADMRMSYDGLFLKVKKILRMDPFSGHVFLFLNASRTSCKVLSFDGTGFIIVSKRLETGLFSKMNYNWKGRLVFTSAEFALFFEGANLQKRFIESPRLDGRTKKQNTLLKFRKTCATLTPHGKFKSTQTSNPH